ncbi:MAG: hypothetical protein C9356_14240 [Oleiphilus sp.]|nr:MAG: hypothetical protein C9356_14240 [Oleiphilus sp.]
MHSSEILRMDEATLVKALKTMPLTEMEQHARDLLKDLGQSNYGGFMKEAMQYLQENAQQEGRFEALQSWLRNTLPNQAVMSDIYARLATIIMMIISRKLAKLSSGQNH